MMLLEGTIRKALIDYRILQLHTSHHKPLAYLPVRQIFEFSEELSGLILPENSVVNVGDNVRVRRRKGNRRSQYEVVTETGSIKLVRLDRASLRLLSKSVLTYGALLRNIDRQTLVTEHLKLAATLSERVSNLMPPTNLIESQFIGVHFRNTDRKGDFNHSVEQLDRLAQESGLHQVWLSSDDPEAPRAFQKMLPSLVFHHLEKPHFHGARNLHFGVPREFAKAQLELALADLFMLKCSTHFLPSQSGWTRLLLALREPGNRFFSNVEDHL